MAEETESTSAMQHDKHTESASAVQHDEPNKSTLDITERPSSSSNSGVDDEISFQELEKEAALFQFLTGMKEDLAARLPLYRSDWGRPQSIYTVVNATFFAFVIQLIPALIFAELMNRETQNNLATAETLLSSAIIGIIYAIFAGQPLVRKFLPCLLCARHLRNVSTDCYHHR